jgi:uncharacterized damage-inducible protein DinB
MTPEGASYFIFLEAARDGLLRELTALPEEALNAPLGVPETNTIFASAFHAASASEYWLGVYVGGGRIERDRPSEFTASGSWADLEARWQRCLDTAKRVIDALTPTEYDALRDVNLATGGDRYSVRDCLLHVIEHVNLHLGHIQIARQVWAHRNAGVATAP